VHAWPLSWREIRYHTSNAPPASPKPRIEVIVPEKKRGGAELGDLLAGERGVVTLITTSVNTGGVGGLCIRSDGIYWYVGAKFGRNSMLPTTLLKRNYWIMQGNAG